MRNCPYDNTLDLAKPETPVATGTALKGGEKGVGPVILAANCSNCGGCIDVCSEGVFAFGSRFNTPASTTPLGQRPD